MKFTFTILTILASLLPHIGISSEKTIQKASTTLSPPCTTPQTPTITAATASICEGGSVVLTASPAQGYLWSTGETTSSITVSGVGPYRVRAISDNCTSASSEPTRLNLISLYSSPRAISGFTYVTSFEGKDYYLSNQFTTWTSGRELCIAAGGTLACIETEAEWNAIRNIGAPSNVWIGLTDRITEGVFLWENGAPVTFVAWTINQPDSYSGNEDFVHIYTDDRFTGIRGWNDYTNGTQSLKNLLEVPSIPISAASNSPVLAGTTINFTVSNVSNATYSWAGPNGFESNLQNPSILNSTELNEGYYIVTINAQGCQYRDTLSVVVNCVIPYSPTISGDTTICQGGYSRLTSSALTGNLWSTGDTTQFINVGTPGSYTVSLVSSACTSNASSAFRVINRGPSSTRILIDTTSNTCLGTRIQLTPEGNYAYYQWSTGERTRSIYTRTSGQYYVQVANTDSCFGLPSPPVFINFDTVWCSVEIFRVGLDSISANLWADYYIWYLNGIELLSSNNQKTIPIQGDGVYTFRAVNGARTSLLSNPIIVTSSKKSLAITKFEVFPNPATDKVTIKTTGTGTLEIVNVVGQVVMTQPAIETNEINVSKLAKGVYSVRFNGVSKILVVQ